MAEERAYSVVICSFNKLSSLRRVAMKVKLLRPSIELILSDDHSTDGTIEWVRGCGLFDRYHVEEKEGHYRLNTIRNAGIDLATRGYVVLLDADCLPEDSFFAGYDEVFAKYPNAAAIGITNRYDADGEKLLVQDARWSLKCGMEVLPHEWTDFYGGNVAFPKALWINDKFDEDFNGNWGFEDLDLGIRWNKKLVPFFMSPLARVRHLDHPRCQQSVEAHSGRCINRELFEKKHGGRFFKRDVEAMTITKKKIVICKNVKPLRNGRRNPKDYPHWNALRKLLEGHEVQLIEGEVPLEQLKEIILGCDFWISPDSFFQHFAWSLKKPGAVIFSVTDPNIYGHPENLNILKDRKYLRVNQFLWMEKEAYNPEAFASAEEVYQRLSERFLHKR